ncbi:MAG: polysaccharide biosynthesis/export family protein, partial [Gammaproteobacteria bacterium]
MAQNVQLTPEQIAQLQSLSPEQLEALLRSQGLQQAPQQQQPLTEPMEIVPRQINSPSQDGIAQNAQSRLGQETLDQDVGLQETPAPLEQFGYNLFAGTPTTFAPATNIPVPTNYIMGPGDTVVLQLYGQQNATYELVISREGMLLFPEIGPISVAGITFEELRNQINEIVSNQLIGQRASVALGTLRSIRIFVLGE